MGIETYLLDTELDCYGKDITVIFFSMLRKEARFDSFEHLKKQLAKDKKAAADFHHLFKQGI